MLLGLVCAPPAAAQPRFLDAARFSITAASILNDEDPRFAWEADFFGTIDLIDYGAGRLNFLTNYETILGTELQAFDPNQGNYTLEGSSSARLASHEVALVFHHVSRHLSDRAKRSSIDWNIVGGRYLWGRARGTDSVHVSGFGGWVVRRSRVDYRWVTSGEFGVSRSLSPRVGLFTVLDATLFGTEPAQSGRTHATGGGAEVGTQLIGSAASLALFVRAERRIDPDPLTTGSASWVLLGFRLSTR